MSQKEKPRIALNNITAGGRDRSEWSGGPSDIEGKTTRVGASECGQRTSFNCTRVAGHLDEIQGVVANPELIPQWGRWLHPLVRRSVGHQQKVAPTKASARTAWKGQIGRTSGREMGCEEEM